MAIPVPRALNSATQTECERHMSASTAQCKHFYSSRLSDIATHQRSADLVSLLQTQVSQLHQRWGLTTFINGGMVFSRQTVNNIVMPEVLWLLRASELKSACYMRVSRQYWEINRDALFLSFESVRCKLSVSVDLCNRFPCVLRSSRIF